MTDRDERATSVDGPAQGAVCPACGAPDQRNARCEACQEEIHDSRLGVLIDGRYRIDALLGVGGFGRVYRGVHLGLNEVIAVKFLLHEWSSRAEIRTRFKREAVALARLRHPGIVTVFDAGEHNGELYMAMELIRGDALDKHVVVDGRPMAIPRAISIIESVLEVLEVSHAANIVHRDLKPENVMLLGDEKGVERVKILDFGLALMTDEGDSSRLTSTETVHGTPLYMSPEQCRGRDVGTPTDIYAVGTMLYELLTGQAPFAASSRTDLMVKQIFVEPSPMALHGARRVIAPGVEAVARWALAKNAAERPTAQQFREALRKAVEGRDDVSRDAKAATTRVEASFLSRDERAAVIPSVSDQRTMAAHLPPEVPRAGTEAPRVILWGLEPAARDRLLDVLAVHGIVGAAIADERALPMDVAGSPVRAVLLESHDALARVPLLRAERATSKVPVLVLANASGPSDLAPALIRAGASDVVPAGASDEALCKQLWRLIRRGR